MIMMVNFFDVSVKNLKIILINNNRSLKSKNNLQIEHFENLTELKKYLKNIIIDFAYGKIIFLNEKQQSFLAFSKMWDYFKPHFNKEDIFPSEYGEQSEYFDYNHEVIDLLVDKFISLLNE